MSKYTIFASLKEPPFRTKPSQAETLEEVENILEKLKSEHTDCQCHVIVNEKFIDWDGI